MYQRCQNHYKTQRRYHILTEETAIIKGITGLSLIKATIGKNSGMDRGVWRYLSNSGLRCLTGYQTIKCFDQDKAQHETPNYCHCSAVLVNNRENVSQWMYKERLTLGTSSVTCKRWFSCNARMKELYFLQTTCPLYVHVTNSGSPGPKKSTRVRNSEWTTKFFNYRIPLFARYVLFCT